MNGKILSDVVFFIFLQGIALYPLLHVIWSSCINELINLYVSLIKVIKYLDDNLLLLVNILLKIEMFVLILILFLICDKNKFIIPVISPPPKSLRIFL